MKITGTNKDSKCSYCGSTSYGRSCTFGPKKTHVHLDDPLKCSFCGSTSIGPGCCFNPFSKYHQRGIAFNPLALEALQDGIIHGIVMKRLAQPITETRAFVMGLIDEKGNQLKALETIEERNAFTTTDRYLIKLKKLSEKNIDLLNTTLYFENTEDIGIEDLKKIYPIELDCQDEIKVAVEGLGNVVEKFISKGVSGHKIEKLIAEAILNTANDNGKHSG